MADRVKTVRKATRLAAKVQNNRLIQEGLKPHQHQMLQPCSLSSPFQSGRQSWCIGSLVVGQDHTRYQVSMKNASSLRARHATRVCPYTTPVRTFLSRSTHAWSHNSCKAGRRKLHVWKRLELGRLSLVQLQKDKESSMGRSLLRAALRWPCVR
jgi:hypothetical protein